MWMRDSSLRILIFTLPTAHGDDRRVKRLETLDEPLIEVTTPSLDRDEQEIRYGAEDGDTHPSVVKLIMSGGFRSAQGQSSTRTPF